MSSFELLLPQEYLEDACNQIAQAKKRVLILAMTFSEDNITMPLMEALIAAAQRGVRVEITADVFTYGDAAGKFFPLFYFNKRLRRLTKMRKRLRNSGVHFWWLGQAHPFIFGGRTHSKWCVVDDTVYTFGGVNIHAAAMQNVDYMLKVHDENLANRLDNLQRRIEHEDKSGRITAGSYRFKHQKDTVLVDGGIMGRSIIYRRACVLAEKAEEITLVSQYCPTGKLGRILKKKDAKLYFNLPPKDTPRNRFLIGLGMLLSRNKTMYSSNKYLHAKFIIFKMPGGKKVAISGSYNFAFISVLFGTREIALETRDSRVINQLETFFEQYVQ